MIADARIGAAHECVLKGFRVHHQVYEVYVQIGEVCKWRGVWEQAGQNYFTWGHAMDHNLTRYNFTDAESRAYDAFVKRMNKRQKNRNEVKKDQCR